MALLYNSVAVQIGLVHSRRTTYERAHAWVFPFLFSIAGFGSVRFIWSGTKKLWTGGRALSPLSRPYMNRKSFGGSKSFTSRMFFVTSSYISFCSAKRVSASSFPNRQHNTRVRCWRYTALWPAPSSLSTSTSEALGSCAVWLALKALFKGFVVPCQFEKREVTGLQ
jgi:hypothetical protein